MLERKALGRRIRTRREARGLTLKAVEARAGISATHVSEIERGRTSPTIGALCRIADALETDPAVFLEEEELGEVSVVTVDDGVRVNAGDGERSTQPLTTTVAGGRLQAQRIALSPRRAGYEPHAHAGEEASLVVQGRVRFTVGGRSFDLTQGDAIHYDATLPHAFGNPFEGEAVLLWVSTDRDSR